jgi:hypothetical protein
LLNDGCKARARPSLTLAQIWVTASCKKIKVPKHSKIAYDSMLMEALYFHHTANILSAA